MPSVRKQFRARSQATLTQRDRRTIPTFFSPGSAIARLPRYRHQSHRASRSSALLTKRRLAVFVGHLLADLGNLGAYPRIRRARYGAGPQDRHAAHTAQAGRQCVSTTPTMPSISASTSPGAPARAASPSARLQHLSLDLDVIGVGLRARRLLPLAPQVSQVGNAALIEREAVTLPLDHAFGFELPDVSPAAIEMQRQCRRADGRWLGKSTSRAGPVRRAGEQC